MEEGAGAVYECLETMCVNLHVLFLFDRHNLPQSVPVDPERPSLYHLHGCFPVSGCMDVCENRKPGSAAVEEEQIP